MDLYFAPMSRSLAARISLYELERPATFRRVGLNDKRLEDGSDYLPVNVKGQVPTLVLDDGAVPTEGRRSCNISRISMPRIGSPRQPRTSADTGCNSGSTT